MEVDMVIDEVVDEEVAMVVVFVVIHWEIRMAVCVECLDQVWPFKRINKLIASCDIYITWWQGQRGSLCVEHFHN